jgi:HEAT repeat protein
LLAGVVVLLLLGLSHMPNLFATRAEHEGRPTSHWIKTLASSDAETRHQAIFALGAIGKEAGEAVPALATILVESGDRGDRVEASLALTKMGPAARAAVPALARALQDRDPLVRMNAALTLSLLRREARPAVPDLITALADEENQTNLNGLFQHTIQELVVLALGRASAGTADGVPTLTACLADTGTDRLRLAAVRALAEIGPEARSAAPRLRALLEDKNPVLREAAGIALRKLGAQVPGEAEGAAEPGRPEAGRGSGNSAR